MIKYSFETDDLDSIEDKTSLLKPCNNGFCAVSSACIFLLALQCFEKKKKNQIVTFWMKNKLTIVPKNISLGKYGGLYYKNTKGNHTWLKPRQKEKAKEEILRGGYGLAYLNREEIIDQIYVPQDKIVENKLTPVVKVVIEGERKGLFYYNEYGNKIYLNKSQKKDCIEQILKGGYGSCYNSVYLNFV